MPSVRGHLSALRGRSGVGLRIHIDRVSHRTKFVFIDSPTTKELVTFVNPPCPPCPPCEAIFLLCAANPVSGSGFISIESRIVQSLSSSIPQQRKNLSHLSILRAHHALRARPSFCSARRIRCRAQDSYR